MQDANETKVMEFVLLGFSNFHNIQNFLFCAVLLSYITCVLGNITIFMLVRIESSLHTPMYFFISTFTVLEIFFVSAMLPNLLDILIQTEKTISFYGCFAQMYTFNSLGQVESFLLSVMVFDRYLAITNPLRYSSIMNSRFCYKLAILPWVLGFHLALIATVETFLLDFCGPNKIDHFFCDLSAVQNLACTDPFVSNISTVMVIEIYVHSFLRNSFMIPTQYFNWIEFSTLTEPLQYLYSIFSLLGIIVPLHDQVQQALTVEYKTPHSSLE
ncbi:olfactory receptor 2A25-like [Leptodactylus fuscus]|uniref:olfactory receptor 2A25-like n=1 Tax=Leptodactylus fuscus TaxID=238119 RepID=UPI003F4EA7FE